MASSGGIYSSGGSPDTCWPPDPFSWWPTVIAALFVAAVLYFY